MAGGLDHVLAQARFTGLLRCMSILVGAMQQRLDHVLAEDRLVAVQSRRCIVLRLLNFLTSICSCLMSLPWSK